MTKMSLRDDDAKVSGQSDPYVAPSRDTGNTTSGDFISHALSDINSPGFFVLLVLVH